MYTRRSSTPTGSLNVIVTLDPNKLAEKKQQCLHIGGPKFFKAGVLLSGHSGPVDSFCRLFYDGSGAHQLAYPPDTKAFLYYSISPERPRISGELRLRVTSSDDPASFESGSDLLRTDGQPWLRSLYVVSRSFPLLYEKLREEQFVPDDLHGVLKTLPSIKLKYSRSQAQIYTLNDTFIVDFSTFRSTIFVITEQGAGSIPFGYTFVDGSKRHRGTPFRGAYTNYHLSI